MSSSDQFSCGAPHPRVGCAPCADMPVRDGDPAHGTWTRYGRGCRCVPCRHGNAVYRHGATSPAALRWSKAEALIVVDWDALAHLRPGHNVRRPA